MRPHSTACPAQALPALSSASSLLHTHDVDKYRHAPFMCIVILFKTMHSAQIQINIIMCSHVSGLHNSGGLHTRMHQIDIHTLCRLAHKLLLGLNFAQKEEARSPCDQFQIPGHQPRGTQKVKRSTSTSHTQLQQHRAPWFTLDCLHIIRNVFCSYLILVI